MKKISFLVCIITIVCFSIIFSKIYDNKIQSNIEENNESYSKNLNKENLKQLVMVNGEVYYNTEKEITTSMKCGTMDGEVVSMVKEDEIPKENNQSNFGKGYGYQIGIQDGQIVLNINSKWIVFEKLDI